jgi:hypothetical protein
MSLPNRHPVDELADLRRQKRQIEERIEELRVSTKSSTPFSQFSSGDAGTGELAQAVAPMPVRCARPTAIIT